MDKEAREGMGQATTTGDEGGDKYGTQRPTSEADEDWRPERRPSDESDGSDTDSSSTTDSSSGGTSSTSSESSSDSGSSYSSAKVVVATGHKKVYKKTTKQPRGQGKQVKSGKAPVAASVAQKRFETTVLWDWAPHEAVTRNAKCDETYVWHDWAPREAPSSVLGRAEEKSSTAPPGRGCGRLQPPLHW